MPSPAPTDLGGLETLLGYRFRDRDLIQEALTHASAEEVHNERLEYLGDAVLNLVAAEELYLRFPDAREGPLTEWKSRLVSRATLARVAVRLDFAPWLVTGGSLESRRSVPHSVLGNALEAILGAIYLDAGEQEGVAAVRAAFHRWMGPELASVRHDSERRLAKQILQLASQKHFGRLPRYRILERFEHPETTAFLAAVEVAGRSFPPAWGTTKKQAERWAAWEAILVLRAEGALDGGEEEDRA